VIGESPGESEELDWPCGQTIDSGEVSNDASKTELSVAENVAVVDTEKGKESAVGTETESLVTVCANDLNDSVGTSGTQPDLLAIIWKSLQDDRARNEGNMKEDERIGKEEKERDRKLVAGKWGKLTEKLSDRFRSDVYKLNETILQTAEQETGKLLQDISALKTQTQQGILDVNCKLDRVDESVKEKLKVHMEKARLEHVNISKTIESRINTNITSMLEEYRTEVEKNLEAVRKEVSNLKQEVAERGSTANLAVITILLDSLQEQVTVASRRA
jgi:F0F1-type ATP synthase membrane subunit b/b'